MKVRDVVQNFILKDENGIDFELYRNLDKKILLVFYPKDNTPVCSSQLADYNQNLNAFSRKDIKVVGISTDTVETHSTFCNKLKLKFSLLADPNKAVSKAFDAINFFGMTKRLLVLIGTDKKVLLTYSTLSFKYIKSTKVLEKVSLLSIKEMT